MKISELEQNTKVINLVAIINKIDDATETPNGIKFQEGILEDDSGQVKITFWGDQVNKFKEGDKIILNTGWCKSFEDDLQVSSGKFGKINLVPKEKP